MNVLRSSLIYSFFTSISRVLGYVRDILIAIFLGTGVLADIFFVAFRLPNTFRRIFSEGALNSAFVPIYSKLLLNKPNDSAKIFAGNTLLVFFIFTSLVVIVVEVFMPYFVMILAPGFLNDENKFQELIKVSRIIFPFLILICLSSLYSSILNSHNKFALSASLPIFLNIALIASLILAFFYSSNFLLYLSWGVIIGGMVQLILLICALTYSKIEIKYFSKVVKNNMKKFFQLFSISFFSSGLLQINILIGTIIASFESGAISYLYYADRVYQLPLALIGIAIGIVLLPAISLKIENKMKDEISQTIENTLIFALLVAIPASIGIFILPELIVEVLFKRGEFNELSTLNTSLALKYYSFGLVAFILMKIYNPIFFAYEDAKPALYVTLTNLIFNTIISIILFLKMGFIGIAIGTSVSAWLSVIMMQYFLSKNNYYKISYNFLKPLFIIFLSSIILYFYLTYLEIYSSEILEKFELNKIIFLLFSVLSSIFLYFFVISFYKPFSYTELKKVIIK